MDNLSDRSGFNQIETVTSQNVEQGIDLQMNLPEYCTDIRKILKCFVLPNIFACGISGDRATADGEAVIRVLYTGESNRLECYEQSVPFSKYIELSSPESDLCIKATAKTEYVNCRAASQRRISVSASIGVHFCITRISNEKLFGSGENDEIETAGERINCTVPLNICNKMFEMSETAVVPESLRPVSSVIKTHTYALIDSVKTIADKMLIKGDMVTEMLYCADNESGSPEKFRHTMPISQIIDLDGIDEDSLCNVDISILSVCASFKTDSNNENRLLDISVKALACVSAYEERGIDIVSDGYSTSCEVDADYKNLFFKNHIFTYKETQQVRSGFDVGGLSVAEITDVFAFGCEGNAISDTEKICGKGEVLIGILYKNTQDEYGYTEKTVDFSFECRGKMNDEKITVEPVFTVTEISGSLVSGNTAEIRLSVNIAMPVFGESEKKVCTRLEADENRKKMQSECPLTVYFSSEGEKLWDIARRYNTTCAKIKDDNDLTGEVISDKTMLLISSV